MFDAPFDTAGERLRQVSATCISAFADVTANLAAVRSANAEISAQLGGLHRLLDANPAGDDHFLLLADRVSSLRDALQHSARTGFPGQEGGELQTALRHLGTIGRETKMLMAIASLTRVVAAEHNDADLEDYVENLRDLALRIAQGSATTQDALDQSLREVRAGRAAIRSAATAVDHMFRELSDGAAQRARLAADLATTAHRLSQVAASFPDAARAGLNTLIEAIQFADNLGQRLSHIPPMMDRAQGREQAVGQLARAQLLAAAEDLSQVLSRTGGALSLLDSLASAALDLFSAEGSGSAEGFFLRRRSDLAQVEAVAAEAGLACQGAVDTSARVLGRIATATGQIVALDEDTYAIGLSALNAMLLTGRGGRSRVSLKVLSDAVRASANLCADACTASREALTALGQSDASAALDRIQADFAQFTASILATRSELDRAGQEQAEMEVLRSQASAAFARLVAATRAGAAATAKLRDTVTDLGTALPDAGFGNTAAPSGERLSDLMALYTMAREREVHATFCGADMPESPGSSSADRQSDLSDILF